MILLTGAAGFIGSNVLAELNRRGITDIICVDNLDTPQKCANFNGKKFVDYLDCQELFLQRLPKLDAIIHLGAISNPAATETREIIDNNFTQTKRLFRVLEQQNCPFVYASSASVYGTGIKGFREDDDCENPQSPYALSKFLIDQYVRRFDIPAVGLRYFNVYGSGEAHKNEYASFAYKIFCAVRDKKPIKIFQHPTRGIRRDFVYIKDAVAITLQFVTKPGRGIYNVGTGVARGFDEMLEIAIELLRTRLVEVPPVHKILGLGEFGERYQTYTKADITKLQTVWDRQFISLEAGMLEYWETFNRREWCEL